MMNVALHQLRGTVEELQRQLEDALASDAVAEKKKKRFGFQIGIGCSAMFLSIFVVAVLKELGIPFAEILPIIFLVVAVLGIIGYVKHGKFDLDNRKLEVPSGFLQVIAADTPKETSLYLAIDFRDYQKGGKLVAQDKDGGFLSQTVRTYKYQHEWLRVSGALADGSSYRMTLTDNVTRKEKPKRKYTKVREATRGVISLQLVVKPSKNPDASVIANQLQAIPPPSPLILKGTSAKGKRISVVLQTPTCTTVRGRYGANTTGEVNIATGETLLQAMLWIYDGLARARTAEG